MNRGYNFNAGPAMLPESLLVDIKDELLSWQGLDISILEAGHRSQPFIKMMKEAEDMLREILSIPDNYKVVFMGGAARTHFALTPMNLLTTGQKGGYIVSGLWSSMAFQEADKMGKAILLAGGRIEKPVSIPDFTNSNIDESCKYVYYTPNETVNGIQFHSIPDAGERTLVADMTSCLLTEPLDISRYGLIFAGAQKNIANAGMTLLIIRDDLLESSSKNNLPSMFDYNIQAKYESLYATPPTFNCYVASKMFSWIKKQGGVKKIHEEQLEKSALLYQFIDESDEFYCPIEKNSRSDINVCFYIKNVAHEQNLLNYLEGQGLYNLKGHRLAGGFRASLYNSMPLAGVQKLIDCLKAFSKDNLS